MKLKALFFFSLLSAALLAQRPQEEITAVSAIPVKDLAPLPKKKTAAALSLPFLEDFSYDSHKPDSSKWEDDQVYINQTFGYAPPSLGYATFDGLDRDGLPYDLSYGLDQDNPASDTCDVLTSKPIDLANAVDSVYFSFFWQAGGLGETPENKDSLNLELYVPSTDSWQRIWGVNGTGLNDSSFIQEMIYIPVSYYKSNFRFRFRSYGNKGGSFDHWHIDYLRLDDQRTKNDTVPLNEDPAFTRPHPTLLNGYEAVPWFHYNDAASAAALNRQNITLHYQRNTNEPPPYIPAPYNLSLAQYRILHNGNVLAQDLAGNDQIDNTHEYFKEEPFIVNLGAFNNISPYPNDEFEIISEQFYGGLSPAPGTAANDTIVKVQEFKNYYAYDDGSAERAYQVSFNANGFILSRFDILSEEDLKGLYLYFLPANYNVENNSFHIVVYEMDANEEPGNLLYESDSLYQPRFTSSNFLLPYMLEGTLPKVDGSVFIGIRQSSNVRLPIGLDMSSNTKTTKFYGRQPNDVYRSFTGGNLMMRPILRYDPKDLSTDHSSTDARLQFSVYPNPANDRIFVNIPVHENDTYRYSLLELSGKLVQSGKLDSEILPGNHLSPGVYILQIASESGSKLPYTQKIILQR